MFHLYQRNRDFQKIPLFVYIFQVCYELGFEDLNFYFYFNCFITYIRIAVLLFVKNYLKGKYYDDILLNCCLSRIISKKN